MKLHSSPFSPFVRKVLIVLHETGLSPRVATVRTQVAAISPNRVLMQDNPLSKIPTLVLDDGTPLYDSRVICEYLDSLHDGDKLFPAAATDRWSALRRQAFGDGIVDALLLWRHERSKPPERQVDDLLIAFAFKIESSLSRLEKEAEADAITRFDIGHVAVGCALSYLDFRFSDLQWRERRPRLAQWHSEFESRPSVQTTRPDVPAA